MGIRDKKVPRRRSIPETLTALIRRLFSSGREPESPRDPFANRLAPLRRGPKGRTGAAAVAEPDDE